MLYEYEERMIKRKVVHFDSLFLHGSLANQTRVLICTIQETTNAKTRKDTVHRRLIATDPVFTCGPSRVFNNYLKFQKTMSNEEKKVGQNVRFFSSLKKKNFPEINLFVRNQFLRIIRIIWKKMKTFSPSIRSRFVSFVTYRLRVRNTRLECEKYFFQRDIHRQKITLF